MRVLKINFSLFQLTFYKLEFLDVFGYNTLIKLVENNKKL